jgi:L-lactate dehydrogenase complex protein LldE
VHVGLFITCLTDTFQPRVGAAVVAVLRRFGCLVRFPAGQTCCGQPAYNNGLKGEAAPLVERLARLFEADDHVVSPSASCVAMVKLHGPELFEPGSAARQRVETLGTKLYDFTTFLTEVLEVELAGLLPRIDAERVMYHYPCHNRGMTSLTVATSRAQAMLGDRYVPLNRADQCCGFGGAFATEFGSISGAMLEEKLECVHASGADVVICDEAGCRMNIAGGLHRRGRPVRVAHTAELLAEAMGLSLPEVE